MTCDAHFQTWLSYSNQKSCVKILFGLVEPVKSYCGNRSGRGGGGGGRNPLLGGYM